MKARVQRIRIRLVAALISTATFLSTIAAANAGNPQILLCESARGQANSAAGPINLPNLSTSYQIDAQGCVLAQGFGDIAIFRSAGFSEAGKERSIVFNSGVASGTTSFQIGSIPAGAYLQQVIFST
jgi:hypothetical protein